MGYDPFSPLAAAHINVLCLPASRTLPERFETFLDILRKASVLPFRSISPQSITPWKDDVGSAILRIGTFVSSERDASTDAFDINRSPQVVLGFIDADEVLADVGDGDNQATMSSLEQDFLNHIEAQYTSRINRLVFFTSQNLEYPSGHVYVDLNESSTSAAEAMSRLMVLMHKELPRIIFDHEESLDAAASISQPLADSNRAEQSDMSADAPDLNASHRMSNGQYTLPTGPSSINSQDMSVVLKARRQIVTGITHLQAGNWRTSLEMLTSGATLARDVSDNIWHAKALEGLLTSMLLLVWDRHEFEFPQNCYPNLKPSSSSSTTNALADANRLAAESMTTNNKILSAHKFAVLLPGLVASIIQIYESLSTPVGEKITPLMVCESRIRLINIMVIVRKHDSRFNRQALDELVFGVSQGQLPPPNETEVPTLALPKSVLTRILIDSATEAQARLTISHATPVYLAVSHSLAALKLDRKQGFYLKELLLRLAPGFLDARKVGAAELGVHPAAGLPALPMSSGLGEIDPTRGVRSLLNLTAGVYGISGFTENQNSLTPGVNDHLTGNLASWLLFNSTGDIAVKLEVLRICVRACDALPDPLGSAYYISKLLQMVRQAITVPLHGIAALPLISAEEQSRLFTGLKKVTDGIDRNFTSIPAASYWDDFLLRDVQLIDFADAPKLISHTARDLRAGIGLNLLSKKDPFIYNPFSSTKRDGVMSILVAGESANFRVVLQNPLEIDIEIEDISLMTEGCNFKSFHHSIVLGQLCCQEFNLMGAPSTAGQLKVIGCKAKIRGCREETFFVYNNHWNAPKFIKRGSARIDSLGITIPEPYKLNLEVIEPLPGLYIESTSLDQYSVMIMEGETKRFTITLRNESDLDADLVLFSYEDSVSRALQEVLANKDLNPAELYEMQHQISVNPAISSRMNEPTEGNTTILARSSRTFDFALFGKPGLREVTVLVDYAHLGKPSGDLQSTFYTRQMRCSIATTVNGSIDIPRCSILPANDSLLWIDQELGRGDTSRLFMNKSLTEELSQYSLLLLDLRNIWPQPMNVDFEIRPEMSGGVKDWKRVSLQTLQPGHLCRVLVPIPRIFVAEPFTLIPSLDSKRQFVVSVSKVSMEAEIASRESFWYREKLLERLRATWKEVDGSKSGILDMRKGLRLSPRMIDALKYDHVDVSFSLQLSNSESPTTQEFSNKEVTQSAPGNFLLQRNHFATLTVKVQNRTGRDARLLLRLQPTLRNQPHSVALDLSRRFAWSGVLQRALNPIIKDGESREAELGVIALAVGEYDINATVEEIGGHEPWSQASIDIDAALGRRRIWHSRRPCRIDAVETTFETTEL